MHIPKVGMLLMGAKSMMVAAGIPPTVTVGAEVATRVAGAAPKVQAIVAPDTTCCPMSASSAGARKLTVFPVAPPEDLGVAVATYRRDGYVITSGVLDADTVAASAAHLGKLQARAPFSEGGLVTPPLSVDPFLAGLTGDARLAGLAAALLGSDVVPFGCTYVVKDAQSGLPALWHQDGHPWRTRLGISAAVTLWIALDPADAGNGGLEVIPGSHRLPAAPLRKIAEPPNLFGWGMDPAGVDARRAVRLSLEPGDASAHHPNLIHCSSPNPSPRRRRALVIRYRSGSTGEPADRVDRGRGRDIDHRTDRLARSDDGGQDFGSRAAS
jgi:phytanoyl-CoA hydroxylase